MKIAIFTDSFVPQVNGVVTATINLAKGLSDDGHEVIIVAPAHKNFTEFRYPRVTVRRVFSVPAFFYEGFKFTSFMNPGILKLIREEKVDIIHFQTPITLGMQAVLISKILKIPLVGTFHTFFEDPQYLKHVGIGSDNMQKIAWEYTKIYYNSCDLITCPSKTTKRELSAHRIRRPIRVISNGIDASEFDGSKSKEVRKRFGAKGGLLLFVGRVAHEKNIFYLIDCFALALKRVPEAKLIVVGSGPQLEEVKAKVKSLGINKNVILTGRIEHDKLVKSSVFSACDLFVSASTTENQPMTVLEAQANGLVCVCIGKRGMSDLIFDGKNGFLVKDGDKRSFADRICKLLSDKDLLSEMRAETLRMIKNHEIDKVMDVWEKEYSKLIKKSERRKS
jgi:glycosyltransferase involved in cell wall biosynthesis